MLKGFVSIVLIVSYTCTCTCIHVIHPLLLFPFRRVRSKRGKPKHLNTWVDDEQLPIMTSPKDPVEMQRLNLETEGRFLCQLCGSLL